MSLPKPGDTVKVSLLNGETIEGVVEWIDGNGAWVKGTKRSRWIPLEALDSEISDPQAIVEKKR
ncbi:MAG TPA: hypothetical protein VFE98_00745 [Candidatus Bathyarchaeia archaeon]|nr:hypothetical protein [Candidatus Bathyarchaeia archaeon]